MASCPACERCPFTNGVCEDRANRGRRFFLMGALALPVARKIEVVAAKIAAPRDVYPVTVVTWKRFDFGGPLEIEVGLGVSVWSLPSEFAVAT